MNNETLAALATILDYNGSLGRGNERLLLIETLRLRQTYDPTDPPPEAPKKIVFKDIPGAASDSVDKEG